MGDDLVLAGRLGTAEIAEVSALLDEVTADTGHEALAEHKRLELRRGGRDRFAGLLLRGPDGSLDGYAQMDGEPGSWVVEIAVRPGRHPRTADPAATLLAEAVDEVARRGGGRLRYWAARAGTADDARAGALGFAPERDLLQLRVNLPLDKGVRRAPPLPVRAFVPGRDEEAWLAVNNRAFAGHPEQGGWDLAALAEREAEPWFDPDGFLLHEEAGRLAGSCWTKVHTGTDPPMGEIYVISVDPDFHQRGLGRSLTVAGLDHLAGRGLHTGMLYVDADNTAATALYLSLGFSLDHIDRAYALEVGPAGGQTPERPTARPTP